MYFLLKTRDFPTIGKKQRPQSPEIILSAPSRCLSMLLHSGPFPFDSQGFIFLVVLGTG
jgi:hypothetical protein